MKELIYIIDYSNTLEKQINLLNLVKSINREVYDVCISSHCILPDWIIELCDYYFYDKKNEVLNTPFMKALWYFNSTQINVEYLPYNSPSSYVDAILRLFLSSLSFLKSLGYKKIHKIEYDCKILNNKEFKNNSILLDKYDLVGYLESHNHQTNLNLSNSIQNPNWINGNLISLNLSNFNFNEFIYNKSKIHQILTEKNNEHYSYCQEKTSWEYLWKNKNTYLKPLINVKNSLDNGLIINYQQIRNKIENNIAIYINPNNQYQLWVNSQLDHNIQVIIDAQKVHNFMPKSKIWYLFDIGTPQKSIEILVDGITIKTLNLKNNEDLKYINSTKITLKQ
jgi:hypothetical protein